MKGAASPSAAKAVLFQLRQERLVVNPKGLGGLGFVAAGSGEDLLNV
jgi:hypothetical protein